MVVATEEQPQQTLLTNFHIPSAMRQKFDEICRIRKRSRSSILNELIEKFIRSQIAELAARNEAFERVDVVLEKSRRLPSFKEFLGESGKRTVSLGDRLSNKVSTPSTTVRDGRR